MLPEFPLDWALPEPFEDDLGNSLLLDVFVLALDPEFDDEAVVADVNDCVEETCSP